jgi:hypothetical protein
VFSIIWEGLLIIYVSIVREQSKLAQAGLKKLEDENFLLRQKIERQAELTLKLSQEKARLENEQETHSERQFHAVKRQENPSVMLDEITQKFNAASSPRPSSLRSSRDSLVREDEE